MQGRNPGDSCRIVGTKWGGSAHFEMSGAFLGAGEGGSWIGMAAGWIMERATRTLTIPYACVFHVPERGGYLARFGDPESAVGAPVYVDITTIPTWTGRSAHVVDLDLDLVRERDGRVTVLDEDEFAANSARLDYPAEVIAAARHSLGEVRAMIIERAGPFGAGLTELFAPLRATP
ncbi:DUF402 domain-containing protein [Microlunatus speluncae]|uniref:DUF402 domain-containing protein n=1 Tax=Microlunatus speluncae TaxID=2594267 RepID=UPI001375FCA8|nr:DUF402 domain-containing protein [Microlunatus speluncae]